MNRDGNPRRPPRLWGLRWAAVFLALSSAPAAAQPASELNLPDPLTFSDERPVQAEADWRERREELLDLFATHIYGYSPTRPADLRFELLDSSEGWLDGTAIRKIVQAHFSGPGGAGSFEFHMFLPASEEPAPVFLKVSSVAEARHKDIDLTHDTASFPVAAAIARGYGMAFLGLPQIAANSKDEPNQLIALLDERQSRPPDAWQTIAAWAWGAQRVMDYLETDPDVDPLRIGVVGHSRSGKTALWAGAQDERFALVVSLQSGCTGAALARRKQGERISDINRGFPHWFNDNYDQYNDREEDLPVDQHQLLALIAPRLVYVSSASEDAWADPEGEFLAAVHASPVYELLGFPSLGAERFPAIDTAVHLGRIGYHLKQGGHSFDGWDWEQFFDYADGFLSQEILQPQAADDPPLEMMPDVPADDPVDPAQAAPSDMPDANEAPPSTPSTGTDSGEDEQLPAAQELPGSQDPVAAPSAGTDAGGCSLTAGSRTRSAAWLLGLLSLVLRRRKALSVSKASPLGDAKGALEPIH